MFPFFATKLATWSLALRHSPQLLLRKSLRPLQAAAPPFSRNSSLLIAKEFSGLVILFCCQCARCKKSPHLEANHNNISKLFLFVKNFFLFFLMFLMSREYRFHKTFRPQFFGNPTGFFKHVFRPKYQIRKIIFPSSFRYRHFSRARGSERKAYSKKAIQKNNRCRDHTIWTYNRSLSAS